ncbi:MULTISPECIES: helix-turn-helix transcriptional regulator [Actinosynnema]|uniref:helix-turn-helix transcriptional regulator n=1 Tax=Actinosynnema TaxID=40566 RepID=UPI0020A4EB78|nr:helix-turn-helix transcriptional regulator [Actinosynnema pretiosum]MCP2097678.1 Helix-turn-helix domain-containing protein [Actinosynnema pretiosum]
MLTAPDATTTPLLLATAQRYLAASVLAAFPSTVLAEPTAATRRDAHFHTLRRAIAFIESNADRDIAMPDIAAAAFVTPRAVQLAFRRHLSTTPMAYLRRVRLDAARTELRASDARYTTVTQVSARWGFGRASAFAAHYRAAYGEPPSRTLRSE